MQVLGWGTEQPELAQLGAKQRALGEMVALFLASLSECCPVPLLVSLLASVKTLEAANQWVAEERQCLPLKSCKI